MSGNLDDLYTFYLENWGWVVFLGIVGTIFILMLIINQRRRLNAIGWLVAVFLCLLVFLPSAVYVVGPTEAQETLREYRTTLFYTGFLFTLVPLLIFAGFLLAYRGVTAPQPVGVAPTPPISPIIISPTSEEATQLQAWAEETRAVVGHFIPESRRQVSAWLVDANNPRRAFQLLEGDTSIGRNTKNDIVIPDQAISKQHLLIRERQNRFYIQDVGSSTGTLLNDVLLHEPHLLSPGDIITIGDTYLRFVY